WTTRVVEWATVLLATSGAWWIYLGLMNLFPRKYFRRAYATANLAGQRFKADADSEGLHGTGGLCSWSVRSPGVIMKEENDHVFMIHSQGTIFIFGKKYLDNEQQQELR